MATFLISTVLALAYLVWVVNCTERVGMDDELGGFWVLSLALAFCIWVLIIGLVFDLPRYEVCTEAYNVHKIQLESCEGVKVKNNKWVTL